MLRTLILLGMFLCATIANAQPQEPARWPPWSSLTNETVADFKAYERIAWNLACEAKQIDCEVVLAPFIAYTFFTDRLGQYRWGDNVVLVDLRLGRQNAIVLIIQHELIHYFQWAFGQTTPGNPNYLTYCEREEEAFRLVNATNAKYGIAPGDARLPTWDDIIETYAGCKKEKP